MPFTVLSLGCGLAKTNVSEQQECTVLPHAHSPDLCLSQPELSGEGREMVGVAQGQRLHEVGQGESWPATGTLHLPQQLQCSAREGNDGGRSCD